MLGLAGVVAACFFAGWERFWANWILWFLFLLTIGLGCLFLVALEHVVGARWSIPLRRVPERLSGLVLLMAPVALLALFSLPVLYPWTHPESPEESDHCRQGGLAEHAVFFFARRRMLCCYGWSHTGYL